MRRKMRVRFRQMQSVCPAACRQLRIVGDEHDQAARPRQRDNGMRQALATFFFSRTHHDKRAAWQNSHRLKRIKHPVVVEHQRQERHAAKMRRTRVEMRGPAC